MQTSPKCRPVWKWWYAYKNDQGTVKYTRLATQSMVQIAQQWPSNCPASGQPTNPKPVQQTVSAKTPACNKSAAKMPGRDMTACGRYPPQPWHKPIAFYSCARLGDPDLMAKIMDTDPYFITQDNGAGAPIHFATTYKQLDMVSDTSVQSPQICKFEMSFQPSRLCLAGRSTSSSTMGRK